MNRKAHEAQSGVFNRHIEKGYGDIVYYYCHIMKLQETLDSEIRLYVLFLHFVKLGVLALFVC